MKKAWFRIALSLGSAAILLAVLMAYTDVGPADVWPYLKTYSVAAYLTALVIHVGIYSLRALRFRVLLPPESRPSFWRVLVLSSAHNMASYVLPAKTGEATWLVYMKGYCGVSGSAALASLGVSRLLDGAALAGAIALSCLWIALGHEYDGQQFLGYDSRVFLTGAGVSLGALVLLLVGLAWRGDIVMRVLLRLAHPLRIDRSRIGKAVLGRLAGVAEAFRHAGRGGRLGGGALLSVAIWVGIFQFYAVLARGVDLPEARIFDDLSFPKMIFGSSMSVVANLLPINGPAGAGTQDGGWVLGFGILGVPEEQSLPVSLVSHAIQVFNVVAMGLLGHLFMSWMGRRVVAEAEIDLPADSPPS